MSARRRQDQLVFSGPPEKLPPNPWWGVLTLVLVLAAITGAAYGAFWVWLSTGPRTVAVPDVTGIEQEAAQSILARHRLSPKVVARYTEARMEAGKVISTFPEANRRVKQGRAIEMIVSEGSAWTWVPDVTEMSLARARKKLKDAHLRLGSRQTTTDTTVPPGYVARQHPAPDTRVRRDTPVDVFLSAHPAQEPTLKYAEVQVSVPPGEESQEIRIMVDDDDGERVAYRQRHDPGTEFTQTIGGRGKMTIRVFAGDALIQEKTF